MAEEYVHGRGARESRRLKDQARALVELLHHDTGYPAGSLVLEAGCGVGAQTLELVRRSPGARFVAIDVSAESLAQARHALHAAGADNVEFRQADILSLPFAAASFDHVFVCFVLEHLPRPAEALAGLVATLRPGGTLTVIEGDHGSACFHPESPAARRAIEAQVELQRRAGGNALIGRQLYPLMRAAGLADVNVSPRLVYVDGGRPELIEAFTRHTFTAMIEGVRRAAIDATLLRAAEFDAGVRDLKRTAREDGVFCYTFFKGAGSKPPAR